MTRRPPTRRRPAPAGPRRGASLLIAVVLLAVTVALLAAAAKAVALHARGSASAESAVQAGLLADAAARLARRTRGPFEWAPDAGAAAVTAEPAGAGRTRFAVVARTADGAARAARSFLIQDAPAARRPLTAPRPGADR